MTNKLIPFSIASFLFVSYPFHATAPQLESSEQLFFNSLSRTTHRSPRHHHPRTHRANQQGQLFLYIQGRLFRVEPHDQSVQGQQRVRQFLEQSGIVFMPMRPNERILQLSERIEHLEENLQNLHSALNEQEEQNRLRQEMRKRKREEEDDAARNLSEQQEQVSHPQEQPIDNIAPRETTTQRKWKQFFRHPVQFLRHRRQGNHE